MPLTLQCLKLPDPDGHKPALLLKGDWLIVAISDGSHIGYGDASHSGDDRVCCRRLCTLFDDHIAAMPVTLEHIHALETGVMARADSFLDATAISGLNQALYDLLAKREGVPTWRLFVDEPVQREVPVYATINRALDDRTLDDYRQAVASAVHQGFEVVKCAPFEHVQHDGTVDDQVRQAGRGLHRLAALRETWPTLTIRVDCHERFHIQAVKRLLPELEPVGLDWLEAPAPIGPDYQTLRTWTRLPIALGELFFGWAGFEPLVTGCWADVIMPDVKHVGGFGPLVEVARRTPMPMHVSPHNPAGPVATAASLHAAAVCPRIRSLEMALIRGDERAFYLSALSGGRLALPEGPGWGVDAQVQQAATDLADS